MTKLPRVSGREIVTVLLKENFVLKKEVTLLLGVKNPSL